MLSPVNLLVVEDSEDDLLLIERQLRGQCPAARCTQVSEPGQIANALESPQWDAVLVDYHLPGVDFLGLLRDLQTRLPDVPIILVSGNIGEHQAVDLLKAGVWDFVLKDRLARLVPAIERGLADAAGRRARQAAELALKESEARLITTREQEHDALADAEARWQFALEGSDLGVWDWNAQTDTVYFSPRSQAMLGYNDNGMSGSREQCWARVHPDDRARTMEALECHIRGECEFYECEHRLRCKDGSYRWVLGRGKVIERAADGSPLRVIGTQKDITDRRVLEDAIRDSEARANLILDSAPEAMLVIDARGIIIRSNEIADRTFCYPPGELVGLPYEELVPEAAHSAHRMHHAAFMAGPRQRAMAEGRNLQARRRDGSQFPAEIGLSPIEIGGERQVIATILDISVRKKAELQLQRFARIVDVSGDMLALVDRELKFIVANPAYAAHAGQTPASLRGRSLREVLGEAMFAEIEPRLLAVLAGVEQHFRIERQFGGGPRYVLDGEYRPFRADGEVCGIVASLRDVTAQVEAERLLERAQSTAKVGNWTYDVTSDVFALSLQSQLMLDRPGRQIPGAEMIALLHPDDRARVRANGMATIKAGMPFDLEFRYRVNGAILHVHTVAEAARDTTGRVVRVVGIMQDVSETREAQLALQVQHEQLEQQVAGRTAELRQQQTYLHALIDNFPFRVWLKDTAGRYLAANRANLNGGTGETLDPLGKTDHDLWPSVVADRYRDEDQAVMRERRPRTVEVGTAGAAGSSWFEIYKAPVVRMDGEVLGTVGYTRDITERKTLEAAREAALLEAQRLARVRSEFLANMSHEIRTPLSAILGLAQVGLREDAGRRSGDAFARIVESGELLLGVINDILDFSKIEAGKLSVESVSFDPCEAIDRAVDFTAAQAEAKGLEFAVEEAADLPASCLGDALRLSQVLVNLLSNAVKFTEAGRVGLSASRDGDWLRFDIVDTGIGMQPDQVGRLFQPFEQADSSTTRRFGGSGLGLAISHRLAELMGGELSVGSRLGAGSRFTLRLPLIGATEPHPREAMNMSLIGLDQGSAARLVTALAQREVSAKIETAAAALARPADLILIGCQVVDESVSAAAELAIEQGRRVAVACHHQDTCATAERLREHAAHIDYPLRARHLIAAVHTPRKVERVSASASMRLRGVRVLAAEDNPLNRLVLDEILRLEGAKLTLAEDGERAIGLLQSGGAQAFDIVLTDIQMPGIDGYETARRILAFAPALPVIGLTAHAMREERDRCMAAGMVEHLAKPIDFEALVAAVLRHVPPRRAATPLAARAADYAEGGLPASAAIDWAGLEARFPGRVAFIDRLAETLLRTQSETPARLRAAAAREDRAAIIFIAHTLKGMAGNLMAPRLVERARETEAAGRAESPGLGRLAISLADAMADVIEEAKARMALRHPQSGVAPGR
ncbi:MAG: PAS domain S-box protein [Sterolibacteriaceae bacterium]|uniref:Virulence sensor protein BvgS n=1 Tax=Candidatus Methylophosphatis roskildensis TaxID=2899263 RepID=A0A9D7HJE3_9PROT|nr:PAS domain S-box protein [Candidatus Methylophosphatis roskildensis]